VAFCLMAFCLWPFVRWPFVPWPFVGDPSLRSRLSTLDVGLRMYVAVDRVHVRPCRSIEHTGQVNFTR